MPVDEREMAIDAARVILANINWITHGQQPDKWPTPEECAMLARQYLISQFIDPDKVE